MEFQDVVRKRKMIRSFEDRPIPHEIVERIVANVQKAPSAGFSQGWGFLVLEGKEDTARFWDANWPQDRRADWGWPDLFNAPLLIVCLSNKKQYLARYAEPDKGWTDMDEKRWPVPYWDIDTGMALSSRSSPLSTRDSARSSSESSIRRRYGGPSIFPTSTRRSAWSQWVMRKRRIVPRHRSSVGTERPRTSCAGAVGRSYSLTARDPAFANNARISRLKAGMSSGLRLVTQFLSTMTS